jgi:hypothetical protein
MLGHRGGLATKPEAANLRAAVGCGGAHPSLVLRGHRQSCRWPLAVAIGFASDSGCVRGTMSRIAVANAPRIWAHGTRNSARGSSATGCQRLAAGAAWDRLTEEDRGEKQRQNQREASHRVDFSRLPWLLVGSQSLLVSFSEAALISTKRLFIRGEISGRINDSHLSTLLSPHSCHPAVGRWPGGACRKREMVGNPAPEGGCQECPRVAS